jgi:hypothetical protein
MSDSVRLELDSFRELEALARQVGQELAGFRRRALSAEARLDELEGGAEGGIAPRHLRERVAELEQQNAALRRRVEAATVRTQSMLDRIHFLRQQVQSAGR